jgi:hypothetical protein
MRLETRRFTLLAAAALGLAIGARPAPVAAEDSTTVHPEYPLGSSKLAIVNGSKASRRHLALEGKWTGDLAAMDPVFESSSLRINGGTGSDTGIVRLNASRWKQLAKQKGFKYSDPRPDDGIRTVLIRRTKTGGKLKITGTGGDWSKIVNGAGNSIEVTFSIGKARWCALFANPRRGKQSVKGTEGAAPASCPCESFPSTFAAIQTVIFDRYGCTQAACHGASPGQGNLDLQPDVAYKNLVGVFSDLAQQLRVERGSRQDSFLWRKLAAATEGLTGVPGTPMPQGLAPLTPDLLEAVRLWIQYGAPEDGVVAGTEDLLSSCLPAPEPPSIEPAAPPAPGTGIQYYAPPWTIAPRDAATGRNGEDEVCYATYHNVADQIPEEYKIPCPTYWGGPTKTCYYFNKTELTQEPNSHHSIIHIYKGAHAMFECSGGAQDGQPCSPQDAAACSGGTCKDSGFNFVCQGGALDGQACDPRIAGVCGDGGKCSGKVKSSLACLTFGPPDFNQGGGPAGGGSDTAPQVGGSQQPFLRNTSPPGVYAIYPAEAVWVWNSHAFNLYDKPVTNEQWYNVYFAPPEDRLYLLRGIFDATDIFVQDVPPFAEREYCRTVTFQQGTRLFELSSHTHKRGRLFRIFGPPIAASCRSTKTNPNLCKPEATEPILVTTQYNDPAQVRMNDAPMVLDSANPADRRLKFCSIYDNGLSDPTEVKRNSTSPIPPTFGTFLPFGGPCYVTGAFAHDRGVACLDGPKKGQPCAGNNSVCDSALGLGDGVCDACPLPGGVTTEDEMFIMLGSYFCAPGTPCETADYTN